MARTVRVTRVTVEYAFEGKAFTVQFDASNIASIVFSRVDFERLKGRQETESKTTVTPHLFRPGKPIAEPTIDGLAVSATSTETGTAPVESGTFDRSLWWHTTACSWFHPEEE